VLQIIGLDSGRRRPVKSFPLIQSDHQAKLGCYISHTVCPQNLGTLWLQSLGCWPLETRRPHMCYLPNLFTLGKAVRSALRASACWSVIIQYKQIILFPITSTFSIRFNVFVDVADNEAESVTSWPEDVNLYIVGWQGMHYAMHEEWHNFNLLGQIRTHIGWDS